MYSFIGFTYISRDTHVLIGDPGVCAMLGRLVPISDVNKKTARVAGLLPGGYYSYHTDNADSPACSQALWLLHDSFRPDSDRLSERPLGKACSAFSGSVFVCDEKKAFDARYCYFALEHEAVYDIDGICSFLDAKSDPDALDAALKDLCLGHKSEGFVTGEEILGITGTAYIPPFLRSVLSTHWSADVARRLSGVPAASIIGGAVSNAGHGLLEVSSLSADGQAVGIRISLDAEEL